MMRSRGRGLVVAAAVLCGGPVQFVRLPTVMLGPHDLAFQVCIRPLEGDRLLTIAAWDLGTEPPPRVQYSELDLEGEPSRRLYMVPPQGDWHLPAGLYLFVATIGPRAAVRGRATQTVYLARP